MAELGVPETEYRVEQATEFGDWTFLRSVPTDSEGKLSFRYLPDSQPQRFYRFRKL